MPMKNTTCMYGTV